MRAAKNEARQAMERTWWSAALPKAKRFPNLKAFIGTETPQERRKQTANEIAHTMRRWRVVMATAEGMQSRR